MEMASGVFLGWLVGFFGKEYMRNLKVMKGKRITCQCVPEVVLQINCNEKTMSVFKR